MQDEEQQQPEEGTSRGAAGRGAGSSRGAAAARAAARARRDRRAPARGGLPRTPPRRTTRPPRRRRPARRLPPRSRLPSSPPSRAKPRAAKKEEVVPGAELDPIAIEPERQLDAEERARREAEEEERARRERELIGEVDETAPVAAKPAKLSGDASYAATGKRKSSVARVILRPGNGSIQVNKRNLEEYFPRAYLQSVAKQPLVQSGYEGNVDVRVRVHGGGISGQAAAVRHGIARALCDVDPGFAPSSSAGAC